MSAHFAEPARCVIYCAVGPSSVIYPRLCGAPKHLALYGGVIVSDRLAAEK